jgi:cytochrome c oxidase subunit I
MAMTFDDKRERTLALVFVMLSFVALAVGGLPGIFQALEHAGYNFYPQIQAIGLGTYYQNLTLHGVLAALVWTTLFISGFLLITLTGALKRSSYVWLSWLALVVMGAGVGMAAYAIFTGQANVLYTFYVPLRATSAFYYIGLTVVIVGTWIHSLNFFLTYGAWRKENPGVKTPLAAVGTLTTWIVWDIATIGVAVEMLWIVIPWSMGLVTNTNPLLARTLFWYFGHPLVYFWLLPAYVSWYTMVPKQAGGKLFSDPLARLAFMLFILLSTPVGLHHQYTDPGISEDYKLFMAFLSYLVAFPSFMTAFTLMASLEYAGKRRGGKGLIGWIFRLPWGDPSFATQVLAMLIFTAGGIGGLVNASYDMNLIIHNTTWVPGHFHLTVGAAATMSFFGITYWLLPYLTKRKLFSKPIALAQAWTWFVGMILFGYGMHWAGLMGAPRRVPFSNELTAITAYLTQHTGGSFQVAMAMVGIGGAIMGISAALFFTNVLGSLVTKKESAADLEIPFAEALSGPENAPAGLDRWRIWVGGAFLLILIAYGPALLAILQHSAFNAPGIFIR